MRPLLDSKHADLQAVLEILLMEDTEITIREVARRHPTLKHASAFTRSPARMTLIEQARQRQGDARHISNRPLREKGARLSEMVSQQALEIETLRTQVRHLVAGHVALIRAVQLAGGYAALERFWSDYRNTAQALEQIGAIPEHQNVVELKGRVSRGARARNKSV
ncbi:hypothetical protein [Cupriavidus necator]